MAEKLYPIGVQSFEKLREYDCYYVDKTEFVWKLTHQMAPIFLSRPRRFGKSLLLSTIHAYFNGQKELFSGLKINDLEKEWKKYPVFHFDFNTVGSESEDDLKKFLDSQLSDMEEEWAIPSNHDYTPQDRLIRLIKTASKDEERRVVILVDEYDKPLLNTVDDEPLNDKMRRVLKPFYGVLKSMDRYIRFSMLTGIARFGKVSIFSDLNNLLDISLNPEFNAVCGVTETELHTYFSDSIEALAQKKKRSADEIKDELKKTYDGYHFGIPEECEDIYNPYSLLKCFYNKDISDYWFESATPSFLMKRLIRREFEFPKLTNAYADRDELLCGITADDSSLGQLYQTGYLTIKDYDEDSQLYRLGFPNLEVEKGFDTLTLKAYGSMAKSDFDVSRFRKEVISGEPEEFMKRLKAFTADFPNDKVPDLEVHWHNITYLLFKLLGFYTRTEYKTSDGRIDAVVKTPRYIYVFEFKMDESPEKALAQIDSKDYPLPFSADGRKLYKIGVEFTSKCRRIKDYLIVSA